MLLENTVLVQGAFYWNSANKFTLLYHLVSSDKTPSHDNQNESSLILMIILLFGQYCVTRIILTICWHENRIYTDDTSLGQEDANADDNNYTNASAADVY